jgi:Co/Zn/Cd efflux system component
MSDVDHALDAHNSTATDKHSNIEKSLGISIALNAVIFIVELVGAS